MAKQKFIISNQEISLDDKATLYLNKKVYSTTGNKIGTIKDVLFLKGKITSLLIKGRNENILDFKYVKPEINDKVLVTIDPLSLLIGKLVFDKEGKKLGKVKYVEQVNNTNTYASISVKKNIFVKSQKIIAAEIETVKENIILNTGY